MGETPAEIAFGVIGRFWGGETRWTAIDSAEFTGFARPGHAKIGCHLHVTALSENRTLLVDEVRTKATDETSRRAFLRYWRVASPFIGIVLRSTLDVITRHALAEAAHISPVPRDLTSTLHDAHVEIGV